MTNLTMAGYTKVHQENVRNNIVLWMYVLEQLTKPYFSFVYVLYVLLMTWLKFECYDLKGTYQNLTFNLE